MPSPLNVNVTWSRQPLAPAVGVDQRRRRGRDPPTRARSVEPVKPGQVLTGAGGAVTGVVAGVVVVDADSSDSPPEHAVEREHGEAEHQAPSSHEPGG